MPVLTLLPITSVVMESEPISLAYLHKGPGHYDAVIRDEKENKDPQKEQQEVNALAGEMPLRVYHVLSRWIITAQGISVSKQIVVVPLSIDARDVTILMVQDLSQLCLSQDKQESEREMIHKFMNLKDERIHA